MPRWLISRPIVTFIACAYAISWIGGIAATSFLRTRLASAGVVGPYFAGAVVTWGPALAALIVAGAINGAKGPTGAACPTGSAFSVSSFGMSRCLWRQRSQPWEVSWRRESHQRQYGGS